MMNARTIKLLQNIWNLFVENERKLIHSCTLETLRLSLKKETTFFI